MTAETLMQEALHPPTDKEFVASRLFSQKVIEK
jgi:hypothetical protein